MAFAALEPRLKYVYHVSECVSDSSLSLSDVGAINNGVIDGRYVRYGLISVTVPLCICANSRYRPVTA